MEKLIDLSHTLNEEIPVWPGSLRFRREKRLDYADGALIYNYFLAQGLATHIDAPVHFIEHGRTISDLKISELSGPACVIDVREAVSHNPDYAISAKDIQEWEKKYGLIPSNAIVVGLTGWDQYWPDEKRYQNQDERGALHFPGFSEEAAKLLVARHISGVGIDTLSIDVGCTTTFPAHYHLLGADKFQIENLTQLEKLPPVGATIFALPIKVENGPEAPARVIALIPA